MDDAARQAQHADMPELTALFDLSMTEVGESKGGEMYLRREARRNQDDSSVADWVTSPLHFVAVGTLDDSIVGFATARTEDLADGARIAEAIEIYVLPEARGVGVGERMLDTMMQWAREQGCIRLEGSVLPGNRAGKNFFERAAMVTRILRVSTSLSPAAD